MKSLSPASAVFLLEVERAQKTMGLSYSDSFKFVERTQPQLYAMMQGGQSAALANSAQTALNSRLFEWRSPQLLRALHMPDGISEAEFGKAMDRVVEYGDISQATQVLQEVTKLIQENADKDFKSAYQLAGEWLPKISEVAHRPPAANPNQNIDKEGTTPTYTMPGVPSYPSGSLPPWAAMGFASAKKSK
jgi:hypothetical protein